MAIELNQPGLRQARALVREGNVVNDERDDWSEAAPTAQQREKDRLKAAVMTEPVVQSLIDTLGADIRDVQEVKE